MTRDLGPDSVTLGWVKAHVGIHGDGVADVRATREAQSSPERPIVTGDGVKQAWSKKRRE